MLLDMRFEGGRTGGEIVAVCACVRFLLSVNERVSLQIAFLTERLVTMCACVRFLSGVDEGVRLQMTFFTK